MRWLEWQNVIFLVPLGIGLVLACLSGLGLGDGDVDTDTDADADADGDADSDGHAVASVLALAGVGRVPVLLLLTVLFTTFGLLGLAGNQMAGTLLVSAPLAVAGSLVLSGAFARVFARVLPQNESYAASMADLAGCTGRVVLLSPGHLEGFAQIQDPNGNMQEVTCKSLNGSALLMGQPIVIVRVQSPDRLCLVSPLPGELQ